MSPRCADVPDRPGAIRVLTLLATLQRQGDPSPSYPQIADQMGWSARSRVHHYVSILVASGHLTRIPGKVCGLGVTAKGMAMIPEIDGMRYIPAAGTGSRARDGRAPA